MRSQVLSSVISLWFCVLALVGWPSTWKDPISWIFCLRLSKVICANTLFKKSEFMPHKHKTLYIFMHVSHISTTLSGQGGLLPCKLNHWCLFDLNRCMGVKLKNKMQLHGFISCVKLNLQKQSRVGLNIAYVFTRSDRLTGLQFGCYLVSIDQMYWEFFPTLNDGMEKILQCWI